MELDAFGNPYPGACFMVNKRELASQLPGYRPYCDRELFMFDTDSPYPVGRQADGAQ